MIAYAIEAARQSRCFDEVMVSTEDTEIAGIATQYGAKVPFLRSQKTADDFAITADVLLEVLHEYQQRGKIFNYLCCLYPTAPLITVKNIQAGLDRLKADKNLEMLMPVAQFSFPVQRALRVSEQYMQYINPTHALTRSQDLEPAYHDAGQFYWLRTQSFLKNKSLHCQKMAGMILPEWQVQDIDTPDDWVLAEMKYLAQKNKTVTVT